MNKKAVGQILAWADSPAGRQPYVYYGSKEGFDPSAEVAAAAEAVLSDIAPQFQPYLVTMANVELIEVGEDWETSTGNFTFDEADLVSCVESQDDPAVRTPILKLGHIDPRFDGQPTFGRVENLRLSANKQTLIGDLVGVPFWLAEIMPTAYPRRSFEGNAGKTTTTGNTWPLTIEALSLLGTAYPAINTLEDLQLIWGKEAPPLYPADDTQEVLATTGTLVHARRVQPVEWRHQPTETSVAAAEDSSSDQEVEVRFKPKKVAAAATTSLDDVRNAFYDSLESVQSWWWIRSVLVNPLQLVVDDDEGGLYMVDVQVDASGNIAFDEPTAIKVEYVAAAKAAPPVIGGQLVAAKFDDAASSGGRVRASADAEVPGQGEGENTVLTEESLRRLGLEPGATDEQIDAAIAATINEPVAEQPAEPQGDPAKPEAPAEPAAPAEPETPAEPAAPAGVTIPEGMSLVDSGALAEMQSGIAASNAFLLKQAERERDGILAGAVKAGKFPRARLDHYRTAWAADAEGTKTLIGQLADGLVPVEQRGNEAAASASAAEANSYPESWKPAKSHSTVAAGSMVKVAQD